LLHFYELKLDGREPVYIQIAAYVKRQLLLGAAVSGERLPSRREIALQLNVNPNTVQKAFKLMEDEGYVHTSGNQGSVLYTDDAIMRRIEEELTRGLVQDFVRSAKSVNLDFKRVIELISEHWE
jgi:Predicted transcriptional regulators